MKPAAIYTTDVTWTGGHSGHIVMGNGPEMEFSAPPDSQGAKGVLTPEDAFVGAANTCIMLMFLWSAERLKLKLLTYNCHAEGMKTIALDRTEIFSQVVLHPVIHIAAQGEDPAAVEKRARRALQSAQKYSLVAKSIKADVVVEAQITIDNQS